MRFLGGQHGMSEIDNLCWLGTRIFIIQFNKGKK